MLFRSRQVASVSRHRPEIVEIDGAVADPRSAMTETLDGRHLPATPALASVPQGVAGAVTRSVTLGRRDGVGEGVAVADGRAWPAARRVSGAGPEHATQRSTSATARRME